MLPTPMTVEPQRPIQCPTGYVLRASISLKTVVSARHCRSIMYCKRLAEVAPPAQGKPLPRTVMNTMKMERDVFPLPTLAKELETRSENLHNGNGVVSIRGMKPADFSGEDNSLIFVASPSSRRTSPQRLGNHASPSTQMWPRYQVDHGPFPTRWY